MLRLLTKEEYAVCPEEERTRRRTYLKNVETDIFLTSFAMLVASIQSDIRKLRDMRIFILADRSSGSRWERDCWNKYGLQFDIREHPGIVVKFLGVSMAPRMKFPTLTSRDRGGPYVRQGDGSVASSGIDR